MIIPETNHTRFVPAAGIFFSFLLQDNSMSKVTERPCSCVVNLLARLEEFFQILSDNLAFIATFSSFLKQ